MLFQLSHASEPLDRSRLPTLPALLLIFVTWIAAVSYFQNSIADYIYFSRDTASARGTITALDRTPRFRSTRQGAHVRFMDLSVSYQFISGDGRPYTGQTIVPEGSAKQIVPGDELDVHFRPGDPSRNISDDGLRYLANWIIAPLAVFNVACLAFTAFFLLRALQVKIAQRGGNLGRGQ